MALGIGGTTGPRVSFLRCVFHPLYSIEDRQLQGCHYVLRNLFRTSILEVRSIPSGT